MAAHIRRPRPASGSPKTKSLPIVIAVTASTSQSCHLRVMDGKGPKFAHSSPSCGRSMSLTRTIPASPGLCELQTFGCMFCGVWVTEAKDGTHGYRRAGQSPLVVVVRKKDGSITGSLDQ